MNLPFPPYEGQEPSIFVWYAKQDKEKALPLLKELHRAGYRLRYYKVPAGGRPVDVIAVHVTQCAVFMPLLSHCFGKSDDYCYDSVSYARYHKKTIVPVYLEPEEQVKLPLGLELILHSIESKRLSDFQTEGDFVLSLENEEALIPCNESGDCPRP